MSNPFKSPAPVLPAMGLHSFHNDSPPFAISASDQQLEQPEHLSLDAAGPGGSSRPSSSDRPSYTATSSSTSDSYCSYPDPVASNRAPATHTATVVDPIPIDTPAHVRVRTSSDDEHLSSSRSRRLVTGYLLGNPPSPLGSRPQSPTPRQSLSLEPPGQSRQRPQQENGEPASEEEGDRNPTPPEDNSNNGGMDSPPLAESREEASTMQRLAQMRINGKKPRQDSHVRDRETGYDRLNGLNDGEADLDESAPQAEGDGSEAYLRGVQGPSGEYHFPTHRLRTTMKDESKIPLVIVACGSFSPPTYLHLRMFEMAKDEIVESQTYEIMAGYYSPVSSHYKKSGLAPAIDRVRMCELAVEHTSTWLMVDPWEAGQPEYQRTAVVLEHFDEMLNGAGQGVVMSDGRKRKFKIMLLAGGDLVESFGQPGVWSEPDLHIILSRFGCLIVERAGSDVWAFLLSHDILYHHRRNVIVIKQLIYNDISSTKVRLFVRRGMSIKYLLPNSVIQYIYDNKLYKEGDFKPIAN